MADGDAVWGGRPIRIVVDDRERAGEVLWAWEGVSGVEVSVARLEVGDYEVDGAVVFERKTFADFAASIRDGRLFRQAKRLAGSGRRRALILEGRAADVGDLSLPRHALQGALISVALVIGVPVLRSGGPEETARLILYAARQIRASARGPLPYRGARPRGRRRAQLRLLQGLPGVGPHRAVKLLEAFGSVEAVMSAVEDELCEVPGVGAETARRIRRLVREPRAGYGDPGPCSRVAAVRAGGYPSGGECDTLLGPSDSGSPGRLAPPRQAQSDAGRASPLSRRSSARADPSESSVGFAASKACGGAVASDSLRGWR